MNRIFIEESVTVTVHTHPQYYTLGCSLATSHHADEMLHTTPITSPLLAATKGWQAAIYYDNQGSNEFIPVKPGFWASFNLSQAKMAQQTSCSRMGGVG
jgi:hypothetical protein